MRKPLFLASIPIGLFAGFWFISAAVNPFDLKFPIAELGNCASLEECKEYCDDPANWQACFEFAKARGLITGEDLERSERALRLGPDFVGPGGCRTERECKSYCESLDHIEECLAFAEKYNLMDEQELQEARKVAQLKARGVATPGNCQTREACEAYCENPDNVLECVEFAERAGFISPEEAALIRKTGGVRPGGCRGKEACELYCEDPVHMEACIAFAEQNGLMTEQELAEAKQVLRALQAGARIPGGCRSRECAEEYCSRPENGEECMDFAVAAGFITEQEAREIKKFGAFEGPGGCQGERECKAYCETPDHAEECIRFAVEKGLMDPKEAEMALKMMARGQFVGPGGCKGASECKAYCDNPAHGEECVRFAVDNGFMSQEEAERALKLMNSEGPGGCRGRECEAYCDDPAHEEACLQFAIDNGLISSEEAERIRRMATQGGPGGCRGRECEVYCADPAHAEECILFAVEIGEMSREEAEQILQFMRQGGPGAPEDSGFVPGRSVFPLGEDQKEFGPDSGFRGPGGCRTPEECRAYCSDPAHFDECSQFGGGPPEDFGPRPGEHESDFKDRFPREFDRDFDRQFDEQFKREREDRFPQGFQPPPGSAGPPVSLEDIEKLERQIREQMKQGIQVDPSTLQELQNLKRLLEEPFPLSPPPEFQQPTQEFQEPPFQQRVEEAGAVGQGGLLGFVRRFLSLFIGN